MSVEQLSLIAPLASPLPPPPESDVFTEEQWRTLYAIADTIVPSIDSSASPLSLTQYAVPNDELAAVEKKIQAVNDTTPEEVQAFLRESPSSIEEFKDLTRRVFVVNIRPEAAKGVGLILSGLNSKVGCLLMTQSTTPFHLQPVKVREQILQGWQTSYLPPLRAAVKAFAAIARRNWMQTSSTVDKILGFPRAPVHGRPGKGFDYDFIQFPPGEEPETLETDVVIVGSGCGGGVCAKNLAEAGHRVLVVEKSYHFPPSHYPMSPKDGAIHLFQNASLETTDDSSVSIAAGSVWGGGGTVNWSASLQTQAITRQEWADGGLPFFTSSEFQTSLDRVCERMGVSTKYIEHNHGNRVLLEGARKLGYKFKEVPQNTGGKQHYCGYCSLGCGSAEKQGPMVSFLPDAAKAGAKFIEGMNTTRVRFNESGEGKTAVGIEGLWTSRETHLGTNGKERLERKVVIKAKRVIVSGGTLNSPLLLLRSGLTNPQIGKNLHLHPALVVVAEFDEDIRPWEGGILTAVINENDNEDGQGHGTLVEGMVMIPSLCLPLMPWTSGLEWKMMVSRFRNMSGFVIVNRDRDSGQVFPDPADGRCRIAYTPSQFDRQRALNGLISACKVAYVCGAKKITVAHRGIPTFTRPPKAESSEYADDVGVNDPSFTDWLEIIRAKGLPSPDTTIVSAHQMGTCRMGSNPKTSVIDPKGQVWGTEGLFVADASVFPSASGVNPMVTNMGISDWISRGIARGLSK